MRQDLDDRLARAGSWIEAARDRDGHEAFAFFFIALNAMYGRRQYEGGRTEVLQDVERFLTKVWTMHKADERAHGRILPDALDMCQEWSEALILDPFINDAYWTRRVEYRHLDRSAKAQLAQVKAFLRTERYERFLKLVLVRVIVLRNQIIHGCVTYGSGSKGWTSLEAGLGVLRSIVPAFYALMQQHGGLCVWDSLPYPRLGSDRHPKVDNLK